MEWLDGDLLLWWPRTTRARTGSWRLLIMQLEGRAWCRRLTNAMLIPRDPNGGGSKPRQDRRTHKFTKQGLAVRCGTNRPKTTREYNTMSGAFQTNINRVPESSQTTQSRSDPKSSNAPGRRISKPLDFTDAFVFLLKTF